MCGIFGFVGNGMANKEVLLNIAEKASERGPDGFGIVFWNKNKSAVFYGKSNLFDSRKNAEKEIRKLEGADLVLGHFRMATQGGNGVAHPFKVNGTWLVHNGNVYQKDRYNYDSKTDCDSELVAFEVSAKWARPNGNESERLLLDIANEMHNGVHFAIGVATENTLCIARHGHPVFVKEDDNGWYFCSKNFDESTLMTDGMKFTKSENGWGKA